MKIFLTYPLTDDLKDKTIAVVEKIRKATNRKAHSSELADLIGQLTDGAIDHFYHQPVEVAKINILGKNAVNMAIRTASKGFHMVANKVVGSMTSEQLLIIADYIADQLIEVED